MRLEKRLAARQGARVPAVTAPARRQLYQLAFANVNSDAGLLPGPMTAMDALPADAQGNIYVARDGTVYDARTFLAQNGPWAEAIQAGGNGITGTPGKPKTIHDAEIISRLLGETAAEF